MDNSIYALMIALVTLFGSPDQGYGASKITEGKVISLGKQALSDNMRDPSSTQFRKLYVTGLKEGLPTLCGEFNSKNGYGGYMGWRGFVSVGARSDYTFYEGYMNFEPVYKQYCLGQK